MVIPVPGQTWRHWKGGLYTIVALAHEEATGDVVVVYQSDALLTQWARPLSAFLGRVKQTDGPSVLRFTLVVEK